MLLPLPASRLYLADGEVESEPVGGLYEAVRAHLSARAAGGLVVLGSFGAGKSTLCRAVAEDEIEGALPATFVPLAVVARSPTIREGLLRTVGTQRLDEAQRGERVLLLDGLDEVPDPGSFPAWFEELIALAGPRWVVTSRPSHVRTFAEAAPEQVDTLERHGVITLSVQPVDRSTVQAVLSAFPRGEGLLRSVEGLADLGTSPLLLQILRAALPHVESGRPIDAWGIFDAWLRYALRTGPGHEEALARLEELAWNALRDSGWSTETMSFDPEALAQARIPRDLQHQIMVTELDGRVRFGHRSVFEYLIAARIAPRLAANQGQGPDDLTGRCITDATRAFLVGRVGRMPVRITSERTLIPRGNFVAGGDRSPDERNLRINHLAEPVWIARAPVTGSDWARLLSSRPDERQDAGYLPHWGHPRRLPAGDGDRPIHGVWPEDAEAYAAWAGADLPSADAWEKASRGLDGRIWPWGDHWRGGSAVTSEVGVKAPLPVRAFGAHGDAALFSGVGGVFEITSTPWRGRPERGRVVMGGCFAHPAATARPSLRLSHKLSGHLKCGLRLSWKAS